MSVYDSDAGWPEDAGRADPGCPRSRRSGHRYRITVLGQLDELWSDWFDGLQVHSATAGDGSPVTTLSGTVADQAALRGILEGLWNLNVALLSVLRLEEDAADREVE